MINTSKRAVVILNAAYEAVNDVVYAIRNGKAFDEVAAKKVVKAVKLMTAWVWKGNRYNYDNRSFLADRLELEYDTLSSTQEGLKFLKEIRSRISYYGLRELHPKLGRLI